MGFFDKLFGKKKVQFTPTHEALEESKFWSLIHTSYASAGGDYEKQQTELEKELKKLSADDIIRFSNQYYKLKEHAYTWELWGAIYLMQGGCGDDDFDYFRDWVLAQGKDFFYKTVSDPESLVEVDEARVFVEWEGLSYVAFKVFEELTGQSMPIPDFPDYDENEGSDEEDGPRGKEWDDDDLESMFPKLNAKYGSS
ncbi:MAG: DUF4240 domain-containing protein [Bacteroidetes bacterium]|nr:MAG: DUF4240 domain-containing protein [Bacteroidota bacterium]